MASKEHAAGRPWHSEEDHTKHYLKIYRTLVVLFLISVAGPLLEHPIITLITAFGIAVVKAYLVASHFMHLKIEKRFVSYLLVTAVAFMFLFYSGVAPDVMRHSGRQWENVAAQQETQRALAEHAQGGEHGGEHGEHGGH